MEGEWGVCVRGCVVRRIEVFCENEFNLNEELVIVEKFGVGG